MDGTCKRHVRMLFDARFLTTSERPDRRIGGFLMEKLSVHGCDGCSLLEALHEI